jgi:tetratricopeptide (TPR) repeat protein
MAILISVFGLAALAAAAPTPAGDADRARARRQFERGELHYKLGRFDKALEAYTRAYELVPLPGFLFNIGQAHRELGHYERAIFFYEGYLRDLPGAENKEQVEALIERCRQALAERRAAERTAAAREAARTEAPPQALPGGSADPAEAVPDGRDSEPAVYETWWFWTLVGGAAAAVIGGTAYAVSANQGSGLPRGSLGKWDLRGL